MRKTYINLIIILTIVICISALYVYKTPVKLKDSNNDIKVEKINIASEKFEDKEYIVGKRNKEEYITTSGTELNLFNNRSKSKNLIYKCEEGNRIYMPKANSDWAVWCEINLKEASKPIYWTIKGKKLDSGQIVIIDKNAINEDTKLPDIQTYVPYSIGISAENKVAYNKKYYNKDNDLVSGIIVNNLNNNESNIIYEEKDINNKGIGQISISGDNVVWERVNDYDNTETLPVKFKESDLFLYNLSYECGEQITEGKYCSWPMISGDNIAYTLFDLNSNVGNQKLFIYNIKNKSNKEIVGDNVNFRDKDSCYMANMCNTRYLTWISNRDNHYIYDSKENKFLDISEMLPKESRDVFMQIFSDDSGYVSYTDNKELKRNSIVFEIK